jgi:NAD kinase
MVLPSETSVRIMLEQRQVGVISVDGQSDYDLAAGDSVLVSASEHQARFLRLHDGGYFYVRMASQLGWQRPGGNAKPLPAVGAASPADK